MRPFRMDGRSFGKTLLAWKPARAEVWQVLVVLGILALVAGLIWFWPLQVGIQLHQAGLDATLDVRLRAILLNLHRTVSISEKVEMVLEHIVRRWRETGEPVKVPMQKTIRRSPRGKLLRVLRAPMRYLGKRTRVSRLSVAAEVGGSDAMESALLAGVSWAVVGTGLALVSRRVRLDPSTPRVQIRPNYAGPALRVETDCILRLRLGHAIVAGLWLLRRGLREKELVLWVRDSLRRKGVEDDGRTSDPGPDEDGHGEP